MNKFWTIRQIKKEGIVVAGGILFITLIGTMFSWGFILHNQCLGAMIAQAGMGLVAWQIPDKWELRK
jgi:hypothetical protein